MTLIAGAQLVEFDVHVVFRDRTKKKASGTSQSLRVAEFNVAAGATHEGLPDVEAFLRMLKRTGYQVVRVYFVFSET